jgi:predicted membrane chloride channel (bestrophin family)
MLHGRDLGRQIAFCVRNDDGPQGLNPDIERQRRKMHQEKGLDPDMGKFQEDSGVRQEMEKMCGFRRLQMMRMLVMFWRLMVQHVRDETAEKHVEALWLLTADAKDRNKRKTVTTPAQEDLVKARKRRPLVALAMLTSYLRNEYRSKNVNHAEYVAINRNVHGLINGFNGVDKVHSVPLPFPYAQMILIFLSTYVFLSPFMLVAAFGYACFLPALLLCLAFFGTNEVAIEIEDPFGEDEVTTALHNCTKLRFW